MPPVPKKPEEELRNLSAPRDLVEWVRKMPPQTAKRSAWVDATRADWMPYIAAVRGIHNETILRAICEITLDVIAKVEGPEVERLRGILAATIDKGSSVLRTTEKDLDDLRLAIVASGVQTQPGARPVWMYWTELVLELARSVARNNPLLGMGMAMRLLAHANTLAKPSARPAQMDFVARIRDKLTLGDQ
jgi:hypothetical protein